MAERVGEAPGVQVWAWRHPRAIGGAGRCIGRTDLAIDPRKAKRLAHRIRQTARRHGLPREVSVSTLRRALAVGRCLARWGWRLRVDARLCELDFGTWDGRAWADVSQAEVEAWNADLLHHAPGGGEALAALAARVWSFVADQPPGPCLVVTHGGWLNALLHVSADNDHLPSRHWPAAPAHGRLVRGPPAALEA